MAGSVHAGTGSVKERHPAVTSLEDRRDIAYKVAVEQFDQGR
jgi:hypothetical protein